jgi:hypothetical protein
MIVDQGILKSDRSFLFNIYGEAVDYSSLSSNLLLLTPLELVYLFKTQRLRNILDRADDTNIVITTAMIRRGIEDDSNVIFEGIVIESYEEIIGLEGCWELIANTDKKGHSLYPFMVFNDYLLLADDGFYKTTMKESLSNLLTAGVKLPLLIDTDSADVLGVIEEYIRQKGFEIPIDKNVYIDRYVPSTPNILEIETTLFNLNMDIIFGGNPNLLFDLYKADQIPSMRIIYMPERKVFRALNKEYFSPSITLKEITSSIDRGWYLIFDGELSFYFIKRNEMVYLSHARKHLKKVYPISSDAITVYDINFNPIFIYDNSLNKWVEVQDEVIDNQEDVIL